MKTDGLVERYQELNAQIEAILQKDHPSDDELGQAMKLTEEAKALDQKITNIENMNEQVKGYRDVSHTSRNPMQFAKAKDEEPEVDEDLLKSPHYTKAFCDYMRHRGQVDSMSKAQGDNLALGYAADGGYLAPTIVMDGLLKKQAQIGSLVQAVTIHTLTGPVPYKVSIPFMPYTTDDIHSSATSFTWAGEIGPATTTNPSFGEKTIEMFTGLLNVPVTMDLLESSNNVDILRLLEGLIIDEVALAEENFVINGSGTNQPVGILKSPGGTATIYPGTVPVMTSNQWVNTKLEAALFNLPPQYARQASWVLNFGLSGAGSLYGVKDSAGRAIYNAGTTEVAPGIFARTIMGQPVFFSAFMPDTSGTYPAIVGDLSAYHLIRGNAVSVRVLDQPLATTNRVSVVARVRRGGDVLEPWKLKVGV